MTRTTKMSSMAKIEGGKGNALSIIAISNPIIRGWLSQTQAIARSPSITSLHEPEHIFSGFATALVSGGGML
jgi:hypothetical protein